MKNIEAFAQEIEAIGRKAQASTGRKDYYHMLLIGWFGKVLFVLALVSCYYDYLLLSALLMSQSMMTKWLLMHHIGHGGYNKIANVPPRFHSRSLSENYSRAEGKPV
ncbi:MAG: hypothetical protein HRT35_12885 [Algicola sp.]|nr:hypothetical protein [Algicola sp.]